jgi:hypothetical protein
MLFFQVIYGVIHTDACKSLDPFLQTTKVLFFNVLIFMSSFIHKLLCVMIMIKGHNTQKNTFDLYAASELGTLFFKRYNQTVSSFLVQHLIISNS